MNGKGLIGTLAVLLVLAICQACGKKREGTGSTSASEVPNTTDPYWVNQASPRARII